MTEGKSLERAASRPRSMLLVVAVLTSVCGFLASCGGNNGAAPVTSTKSTEGTALVASSGGTVTVVVPSVPTNLNPHTRQGDVASTRMITTLTDPQVFEVNPQLNPELDTNFVLSAEVVSVNPETVLYELNPKAVWSDGTPITAADFVYDWEEQAGSDSLAPHLSGTFDAASTLGYRDIESITAPTPGDAVKVVFDTPYADWDDLFNSLIPEHVAEVIGWTAGYESPNADAFVSGGPYEITSWDPGSKIVLERNPNWWGTPGRVAKIVVEAGSGPSYVSRRLDHDSAQVVETNDFDTALLDRVSSSSTENSQVSLGTTMLQLVFDLKSANDQSIDLRQAIAYDLNRRQIVSQLVQPLDPNVQVDDDFLAANAQKSYTHDGTLYDVSDPQQAQAILSADGMVMGTSGTWMSGGSPVVLDLRWASEDPWSELVAPAIEAALVQAGFEVKANPVTTPELGLSQLGDSNWDLALVPVASSPYPGQMAETYSESEAVTGQGQTADASGFDDPNIDALFVAASQDLNFTKASAIYQQIDKRLWQAMPAIPLFAEPTLEVSKAEVSGVQSDGFGPGPFWGAAGWSLLGQG